MTAVYSCAYFPNIAYLSSMMFQDEIYIESWENYIRQSYRSRCYINGANGLIPLNVPIEGGRKKTLIKDVRIVEEMPWSDHHLKSIMSAYGKAPFYEHYIDMIESFLQKDHKYLFDLCQESLTLCLQMLHLKISFKETENFEHRYPPDKNDFRDAFKAKTPETFPVFFQPKEYFQLFGKQFVANLSILDLIFCEGPQASTILRASHKPG